MQVEERFITSIEKAKSKIKLADHLTYMTFPIVQEQRLLLKILEEISVSITSTINAILQYEYTYKRIQIYKDAKENFRTFEKLSSKYSLTEEQLKVIKEILNLSKIHKKSEFEFVKKDKVVIMSNSSHITLNLEKIKLYLLETKDFLRKASLVLES